MPEAHKKADEAHVKQPVEVEHLKPKIPEQMMKEKLEKISKNKIEFYKGILKRMNFEVNPRSILLMHRMNKKLDEIGHMMSIQERQAVNFK